MSLFSVLGLEKLDPIMKGQPVSPALANSKPWDPKVTQDQFDGIPNAISARARVTPEKLEGSSNLIPNECPARSRNAEDVRGWANELRL